MAQNPVEQYVLLEYQSAFASHTMTRPVRAWSGVPWQESGTFLGWDGSAVPAATMITGFVTLLLPLFKPDTSFTGYTIYAPQPGFDIPIPVWAANLTGQVGTSDDESQSRAWERTYTFRTSGSHIAKICLLDTPCGGLVSRYNTVAALTPDAALIAYFKREDLAWSGRADERPVFFKTLTTQPNAALENKYGVN